MASLRKPATRDYAAWLAVVAVCGLAAAAPAQQIPLPGQTPAAPPASAAPRPAPAPTDRRPLPAPQPPAAAGQSIQPQAAGPVPATPQPVATPPAAAPAQAQPSPSGETAAAGQAGDAAETRLPLVPVEGTPGLRLSGEYVSARFAVMAPPLATAAGATLSLAHLSGVDLLPDRSVLTVSLNGTAIGTFTPDAFTFPGQARLAIPAGLLKPGRNLVAMSGRMTHRVLCGDSAGFDLWTQLDPGRSGILLPAGSVGPVSDMAGFVASAAAASARGEPLSVSLRVPPTPEVLDSLVSLSTLLGRAMPETTPSFAVIQGETGAEGRSRIVLTGGGNSASVRNAADGAPVLLLQGAATDVLARDLAAVPSLAGAGPDVLQRNQQVTLSALGTGDVKITEHRRQVDVVLRLPADFLVTNDAAARLKLMLAYAAGLPSGAHMTLSVNGTALAMRPFDRSEGEVIENEEYRLPMRLLHAGANRLSFDFSVPAEVPQQACPSSDHDHPFATLFGDSTLTFPDAPHMVALPDLSLMAASGYPYTGSGTTPLLLSDLDPRTIGAALTITARLSASARGPVRFEPTLPSTRLSGPVLAIGPVTALPTGLFADAPVTAAEIASRLTGAAESADPSGRPAGAARPTIPAASGPADAASQQNENSAEARLAWRTQLDRQPRAETALNTVSSFWQDTLESARSLVGWRDSGIPASTWLVAQPQDAIGFVGQWQGSSGPVTLVTATDAPALSAFAIQAVAPTNWSGLSGDAALFSGAAWRIHQPADQSLVMTEPLLASNFVMVAGHWFSRNGTLWTIAVLGLSAVGAGVAQLLLGRMGVRRNG
jgi:hypothetical protein